MPMHVSGKIASRSLDPWAPAKPFVLMIDLVRTVS